MAKVLIVDDSKVVRTMVARGLKPFGCAIVEATNGQEGVEVARREHPDLILLDVTMPVMDGRQALAAIRADASIKGLPVIMLTAESGEDLGLEIVKLGVKGYIVKPFTVETFEKEVSKVLRTSGAQPTTAAPAPTRPPTGALDALTRSAAGGELTVTTEAGCTVIVCPDPQSKQFGRFVPAAQKRLRALAEDGADRLILDLATITQVNTGLVKSLVQLITEATAMGIRTAVCAPAVVIDNLRQFSGTAKTVYAPTRKDALGQLG